MNLVLEILRKFDIKSDLSFLSQIFIVSKLREEFYMAVDYLRNAWIGYLWDAVQQLTIIEIVGHYLKMKEGNYDH